MNPGAIIFPLHFTFLSAFLLFWKKRGPGLMIFPFDIHKSSLINLWFFKIKQSVNCMTLSQAWLMMLCLVTTLITIISIQDLKDCGWSKKIIQYWYPSTYSLLSKVDKRTTRYQALRRHIYNHCNVYFSILYSHKRLLYTKQTNNYLFWDILYLSLTVNRWAVRNQVYSSVEVLFCKT